MKSLLKLLTVAFTLGTFVFATPTSTPVKQNCHCKSCTCTPESHCGCFSKEGCKCGSTSCENCPAEHSKHPSKSEGN